MGQLRLSRQTFSYGVVVAVLAVLAAAVGPARARRSQLLSQESLNTTRTYYTDRLISMNGGNTLIMQIDRQLAIYYNRSGVAIWGSGTFRPADNRTHYRLTMEDNCNLVAYNMTDGQPFWRTNVANVDATWTWTEPPCTAVLENSGLLTIYDKRHVSAWFSPIPTARLAAAGSSRWTSGQFLAQDVPILLPGSDRFRLVAQNDQNVVLYDTSAKKCIISFFAGDDCQCRATTPVWASGTVVDELTAQQRRPYSLLLQDNGDLVLLDKSFVVRWRTGTTGPDPLGSGPYSAGIEISGPLRRCTAGQITLGLVIRNAANEEVWARWVTY